VQLGYGDGSLSTSLLGRQFMLEVDGSTLILSMDLTPNFQTRDKSSARYVDAEAIARNHARLRQVLCDDSLLRTRLLRAWEAAPSPRLQVMLDLGPRGQFAYSAVPKLRFAGGVALEVRPAPT
jgi:hypothetical protein